MRTLGCFADEAGRQGMEDGDYLLALVLHGRERCTHERRKPARGCSLDEGGCSHLAPFPAAGYNAPATSAGSFPSSFVSRTPMPPFLANKLGITDAAELARVEERLGKRGALRLYSGGRLDALPVGTFAGLAAIHRELFAEVYDFAGQLRTVNLAKGYFRFAPVLYLRQALAQIDAMPQGTFDEIVDKYVEMNVAHPFREGNGRSMRIWLDQMLKRALGLVVDWSRVEPEDYLLAMERSPVRTTEIKTLLKAALADASEGRGLFMRGLDASYRLEGYNSYRARDLDE